MSQRFVAEFKAGALSKYYRLLRPAAWTCFLLPFAVGIAVGAEAASFRNLLFATISFAAWMSFSFTVNAIYDRDVDRFHDGRTKDIALSLQPLVTGEISVLEAWLLALIFLAISLASAAAVSVEFFATMSFANLLGYLYSCPPFRFKARAVLDVATNAAAATLIFHAGMLVGNHVEGLEVYAAAFVLAATFYIPTALSDYEFDLKAGLKNTPAFFGPQKTLKALYPLSAASVVLWFFVMVNSGSMLLRVLSPLIIFYTLAYVYVIRRVWDGRKLNVTPNLILVPFGAISAILYIYTIIIMFAYSQNF
ncbi:MAG: UbiA prenyltransferase family protein [Archaeoglobaceae archaeon]